MCDRFGRVRVLQVTILGYAFFTFLSVASHRTSLQLFMLPHAPLQGFGFGGGRGRRRAVLLGEGNPAEYRVRAVGIHKCRAGWSIGWGVAALLDTIS